MRSAASDVIDLAPLFRTFEIRTIQDAEPQVANQATAAATPQTAASVSYRCYDPTTDRRLTLWDTVEVEITLRNAQDGGKRPSALRSPSSLRAMLRLAKEKKNAAK